MDATPADTRARFRPRNLTLKLLCLGLAFSVWCLAAVSRRGEVSFALALRLTNIPAGFTAAGPVPATVRITLHGPRARLHAAKRANQALVLDLTGAAAPGTTAFSHLETRLALPEDVRVTGVSPAELELRLEPEHSPQGDRHP